jgi:intracellular multiplication protein IcmJ
MEFERELILSASRKSWKMSSSHGTEYDRLYKKKFNSTWDKVWERDKFKCYYCDFVSKKHQEIHHLNDDHEDNSMDNLVTVCPLCHQSYHLDTASTTNGGKIIWLPEFSQQELNYLCRAIFIAIEEAEQAELEQRETIGFAKIARMLEASLVERTLITEQHIQPGASDPVNFANALINMSEKQYEKKDQFLKPFKLLHLKSRFSIQTKYWKSNTFKNVPIETWMNLINVEKLE